MLLYAEEWEISCKVISFVNAYLHIRQYNVWIMFFNVVKFTKIWYIISYIKINQKIRIIKSQNEKIKGRFDTFYEASGDVTCNNVIFYAIF